MVRKVLVGTDTSASADLAVQTAADIARALEAGLLVLYVRPLLDPREMFDPDGRPDPESYLEEVGRRFSDLEVSTRQVPGDPGTTICDVAEAERADVIVVGNRGIHGKRRRFIGSVPQAVLQRSPCSVMVVDTRSAQ